MELLISTLDLEVGGMGPRGSSPPCREAPLSGVLPHRAGPSQHSSVPGLFPNETSSYTVADLSLKHFLEYKMTAQCTVLCHFLSLEGIPHIKSGLPILLAHPTLNSILLSLTAFSIKVDRRKINGYFKVI